MSEFEISRSARRFGLSNVQFRRVLVAVLAIQLGVLWPLEVIANPQNPTLLQGPMPTFSNSGSQLTIITANNTALSWSSFNIAVGETTTFVQPSSTSVVWNQINDSNPSQILGNLNANGYVVLQNPNGFYVGGQAVIKANGLIMTTTPGAPPDLSAGGPWSFTLPPPSASIVNYGTINGSAYLISYNIDNEGIINAPGGSVGLYAGKTVLLSTRPDGRGLSAQVTLPEGSVDNNGNLIADGGLINLQAQVVNQNGLIQANTAQNVNGNIELVAGNSVTLGSKSTISAAGAATGTSSGGTVQVSGANYTDQSGSAISVAGGTQGGNGGQLEIYGGTKLNTIHSQLGGQAVSGFQGGEVTIGSRNLDLSSTFVNTTMGKLNPFLNGGFSQINFQADNDFQLDYSWLLPTPSGPTTLSFTAGNDIIFNTAAGIRVTALNSWNLDLTAGTQMTSLSPGNDGIYLLGSSFIQLTDGNINLNAANEVILNAGGDPNGWNPVNVNMPFGSVSSYDALSSGGSSGNPPACAIRTVHGGSIKVDAQWGNIYTGGDPYGYTFGQTAAPYYKVNPSQLGGISTAAGGNVTLTAGGNIGSYLPEQYNYTWAQYDGGCGAFGANPGNLTVQAGGSVSGNYIVANGLGSISALNGDVGSLTPSAGCALNLVNGSWNVSAPHGSIYLQDVRNPNGVFNDAAGGTLATEPNNPAAAGYHYFDYGANDSVTLDAANTVEITGSQAPHTALSGYTPFILPPSLTVVSGPGGFVLNEDVILFPSPNANLQITTQGSLQGNGNYLEMSDSAAKQYDPGNPGTFGLGDHSATAPEINNSTPVTLSIKGDLDNVTFYTDKQTEITVGGNAFNANLVAENLHASDVTSVNVAGSITYSPEFVFANLSQPISSADPEVSANWDTIFSLLVNPTKTSSFALNGNETLATLQNDVSNLKLFPAGSGANPFTYAASANPGFIYDAATHQLAYEYQMSPYVINALTGPLEIIQENPHTGMPVLVKGNASLGQDPSKYYFATTTVSFVPASVLETLYTESQSSVLPGSGAQPGFQIGGPGKFNITAGSMDLGSSLGIISWGIGNGSSAPRDYSDLDSLTPLEQGAAVNVNVAGSLTLLSSTIASVFGGNVNVNTGGELDLSQGHFNLPLPNGSPAYGIYTSGDSDVNVTAGGDINIGNSRIGAFNGGNVFVESTGGNVNAGYGANMALFVPDVYKDPTTGLLVAGQMGGDSSDPLPYGSGILAIAPTGKFSWSTKPLPGNITVETPKGDIDSDTGGIDQFALDGNIAAGPTITLTAGTPASGHNPAIKGNINLGAGGVIGGTVNLTAQGNISGLIVSHQNANIVAAQNVSATVLSGGSANVSAVGAISGTIAGIGGVNASASSLAGASLLGQNVSANGAAAQSTLGTTAAATSASQSAAQASTAQAQQEVASNDAGKEDDTKKKDKSRPVLSRRVGRVTVILPKAN